jgi:hypothetical protein
VDKATALLVRAARACAISPLKREALLSRAESAPWPFYAHNVRRPLRPRGYACQRAVCTQSKAFGQQVEREREPQFFISFLRQAELAKHPRMYANRRS